MESLPAIGRIRDQMNIILETGKKEGLIGSEITAEECTLVLAGYIRVFE